MLKATDLQIYEFIAFEMIAGEKIELGSDLFIDLESAKRAPLHRLDTPVLNWDEIRYKHKWRAKLQDFIFTIHVRTVFDATDKDEIPF